MSVLRPEGDHGLYLAPYWKCITDLHALIPVTRLRHFILEQIKLGAIIGTKNHLPPLFQGSTVMWKGALLWSGDLSTLSMFCTRKKNEKNIWNLEKKMLPDCKIGSSTHDPSRVMQGRAGHSHAVVVNTDVVNLSYFRSTQEKKSAKLSQINRFLSWPKKRPLTPHPFLTHSNTRTFPPELAYIFHKLYLQGLLCTLTYYSWNVPQGVKPRLWMSYRSSINTGQPYWLYVHWLTSLLFFPITPAAKTDRDMRWGA